MTDKPESFRSLAERLARAVAWFETNHWDSRADDVVLANRIYVEWLNATQLQWLTSGERDRYLLITALDAAFRPLHGGIKTEHLCILFTTAFEARARNSGANRQGNDH